MSYTKVGKYFRQISQGEEDYERELYAREAYSEVKSFEAFIDRCMMLQLRGQPPPRGWTSNSRAFSTAYWNLDQRIHAYNRPRPVPPPPFPPPRNPQRNEQRTSSGDNLPRYASTSTVNRLYGYPPSYDGAPGYSHRQ